MNGNRDNKELNQQPTDKTKSCGVIHLNKRPNGKLRERKRSRSGNGKEGENHEHGRVHIREEVIDIEGVKNI